MKKILALVLALVMTMSLATISSGAAYSDADKVQYVDAVNTMSALGVMGGYADGSIRPQADVTRGAAAKMVAMVATGSNPTTLSYYAGTSSFTDVPATHTFADAVAYCVGKGIVEGYGNGLYGVGDNVKGWAVAKMVLVAMGYDAEAYGLTGTGAALRTIELATDIGLFDGMNTDFVATEAASREECAQIIYNALNKACVEASTNTNTGVVTYSKSTTDCLLDKYVPFTIDANVINTLTTNYGKVITANAATLVTSEYTYDGTTKYNVETGLDMIGHKVLLIPTKAGEKTDKVTSETYVDVYGIADLTTKVVEIGSSYYNSSAAFKAAFGYDTVSQTGITKFNAAYVSGDTTTVNCANTGTVTTGTYVMIGNTIVSWKAPADYSVGYVADYAAGNTVNNGVVNVNADGSELIGDTDGELHTKTGDWAPNKVSLYDGIAEGDVVIVEKTGELWTVTKADTAVGTVSKVDTTSTSKSIVVDGKSYNVATLVDTDTYLGAINLESLASGLIGSSVTMYLNKAGSVVAITINSGSVDSGIVYAVAKYDVANTADAYGKNGSGYKYYIQCVDMTGKEVSYQVDVTAEQYTNLFTSSAATGMPAAKGLYKVSTSVDSYGVTYATFSTSATPAVIGDETTAIKSTDVAIEANQYYSSTVKFIYVSSSLSTLKVTVKEGVQNVDSAKHFYYSTAVDGTNYNVQYVVVDGVYSSVTESSDVIYLASTDTATVSEGFTNVAGQADTAWYRTVYIGDKATTIKMEESTLPRTSNTVGFYTYTIDEDGFYTLTALGSSSTTKGLASSGGVEVTNLYNNMITAGALTNAKVTSDTKIVDLYAAANYVDPITSVSGLLAGDYAYGAKINALYTEDADGVQTVSAIYVLAQPTGTSRS